MLNRHFVPKNRPIGQKFSTHRKKQMPWFLKKVLCAGGFGYF